MENERLKTERARVAELNARREAEAKARAAAEAERREAEATVVTSPPPAVEATPETPPTPTLTTLDFRVEATLEQLKALRAFLIANNIKFSKI